MENKIHLIQAYIFRSVAASLGLRIRRRSRVGGLGDFALHLRPSRQKLAVDGLCDGPRAILVGHALDLVLHVELRAGELR